MSQRRAAWLAAVLSGLLIAGCGEIDQTAKYQKGKYAGKPDQKPWETAQFGNDRAKWAEKLKERSQGQNEYLRTESKQGT